MKLSFGMFRRILTTHVWTLTETNLMNSLPQTKNPPLDPMGFHVVFTGVLEGWALNFFTTRTNM